MEHTLKSSFQDAGQGITKILKGELHLAIGEAKQTVRKVVSHSTTLLIAGIIGLVAAVYALAFIFSGVAELLGGNYWLSGLLLTVVFGAVAGIMAMGALKKLKHTDMKLPLTRASLREQKESIPQPVQSVVGVVQARLHKKKVPEPKREPEEVIRNAQYEINEGHELIRGAAVGFTESRKDLVEMGRNVTRMNPRLTRTVTSIGPVAGVVLPALTIGYIGSKKYRERKARNSVNGQITIREQRVII